MKAVVVTSPGKIQVCEVPEPVIGPYDALCEVLAVGVCSGTDNHIAEGKHYNMSQFPLILGHEGIGKIIRCGAKVRYLKTGDIVTRVFNKLPPKSGYAIKYGAFAERAVVTDWRAMQEDGLPEEKWRPFTVHRVLPKNTDPVAATMIITWRETFAFLSRMQPQKEEKMLLIGSGTQALSFAEHGKNLGLSVSVIGNPRRKKLFAKVGVKTFTSYKQKNVATIFRKKKAVFQVIIDTIGRSGGLNTALPFIVHGGRIGVYGLDDFWDYRIEIPKAPGDFSYFTGRTYNEGAAHDAVMKYIKQGKLNAWHYISKKHLYPLEKAEEALHAARERTVVKSVITFT